MQVLETISFSQTPRQKKTKTTQPTQAKPNQTQPTKQPTSPKPPKRPNRAWFSPVASSGSLGPPSAPVLPDFTATVPSGRTKPLKSKPANPTRFLVQPVPLAIFRGRRSINEPPERGGCFVNHWRVLGACALCVWFEFEGKEIPQVHSLFVVQCHWRPSISWRSLSWHEHPTSFHYWK